MNNTLPHAFSFPIHRTDIGNNVRKWCRLTFRHHSLTKTIYSASRRRHHRRRLLKHHPSSNNFSSPPSDQNLQLILTVERFSNSKPVTLLNEVVDSSQLKLNQFIRAAEDAFEDIRTLVTVDGSTKRVVFSCRKSTVQFLGFVFAASVVIFLSFRVLVKLLLFGKSKFSNDTEGVIYRRDRSLGGREVAVAKMDTNINRNKNMNKNRNDMFMEMLENGDEMRKPVWERRKRRSVEKLPQWWPVSVSGSDSSFVVENKEEYQITANRLIRAIVDKRMRGEDISSEDIVKLRRICRESGVRVFFDTENTRDSFYRVSVDFVLKCCERIENQSALVGIDGEDVQHFIAGLAENIGLENGRAARMVSAAVAARTRSCFLQAWALQIQGNHSQAVTELLKICLIHRIFPPDESSAEMEMVAQGLKKQLNVDQRELLFNMLIRTCGEGTHRSVIEALGLVEPHVQAEPQSDVAQQESKLA